ncbi:DUF4845 domain-containing protein [Chitinimonas arctica]|uniref:DUF4845 domain-containing protein n=1 Tax=Chitinimonas arctica TaxID=2594795 RepID=A0A516SBL0_9NEIS|nr:DUF4845 domain-containing protein [Chitinimonas arctica]QDQ25537.1 DUF4845 domain-containing protein [Chitinimonas arctica]
MQKQRGLSMVTMLAWGIILGGALVLSLKLIPAYSEYFGVKSVLKKLVVEQSGAPVSDIRESFDKRANIENISSVKGEDLEILQDQQGTTVTVAYQRVIPLVANVSLLFDFTAEERHGGAGK